MNYWLFLQGLVFTFQRISLFVQGQYEFEGRRLFASLKTGRSSPQSLCRIYIYIYRSLYPLPFPNGLPIIKFERCSHALAGGSWQSFAMAFNALPLSPCRHEGLSNRCLRQKNSKQATEIRTLQREAQKWKDLDEDRGRATVAVSELEEKLVEKTRHLEGHNTRANDAEAKVKELERQVHNLQTDMTQLKEAAGNLSSNPEADIQYGAFVSTQHNLSLLALFDSSGYISHHQERFLRVGSPVCSSSMRAREKLR